MISCYLNFIQKRKMKDKKHSCSCHIELQIEEKIYFVTKLFPKRKLILSADN